MSDILQSGIKRREHTCNVCQKTEPWSDKWSTWGSILTEDAGDILKFCSEECCAKWPDPEKLFKAVFGRSANDKYYRQGYGSPPTRAPKVCPHCGK